MDDDDDNDNDKQKPNVIRLVVNRDTADDQRNQPPRADPRIVEMLTDALDRAKRGEVIGMALVTLDHQAQPYFTHSGTGYVTLIGALTVVQHNMATHLEYTQR